MAALYQEVVQEQLTRMEHNARPLFERGDLGEDVSLAHARDVLLVSSSPELYELPGAPPRLAARTLRRRCGAPPGRASTWTR